MLTAHSVEHGPVQIVAATPTVGATPAHRGYGHPMTARKRSTLSQLRRALYFGQRGIGDAQAVVRGPGAYGRPRARRSIARSVFRLFK